VALIIITFLAFAILYLITHKRLKKQKERIERLNNDIKEADGLLEVKKGTVSGHEFMRAKEMEEAVKQ
jgi:preprotein translocase subunit YajC